MKMKVIQSEKCLCTCCMEEHEVKKVCVAEQVTFKNVQVDYNAIYFYCERAEELYMDEKQLSENDIVMKDAYRKMQNLLTSKQISAIRKKYRISQSDLCVLLGWGAKTITRYESHQVQDKAHNTILKKIDKDPEWFLNLLRDARFNLSEESYQKYYKVATLLYENNHDFYLKKAIEARYARFYETPSFHGNVILSLEKVVDVIRYFAASKQVNSLYKVKLMKLLWYSDVLAYKERGYAITGLIYQALPMGAVPIGHDLIIDLNDVPCEEIDMGYHFSLSTESDYPSLEENDKKILDRIIKTFGKMSRDEIVTFMHTERAYIETNPRDIISFEYAKYLQM